MSVPRRVATRTAPRLELLDERIVPSTIPHMHAVAVHMGHHAHFASFHHAPATLAHAHGFGAASNFTFAPQSAPMSGAFHPSFSMNQGGGAAPAIASSPQPIAPAATFTSSSPSPQAGFSQSVVVTSANTTTTTTTMPSDATTPAKTGGSFQLSNNASTTNSGGIGDTSSGPMAKAGQALNAIYQEYQQFVKDGGNGTFTPSGAGGANRVEIQGSNVGVDARWNGSGSFTDYVSALTSLGMQVQNTDAGTGIVAGLLPINDIPTVVQMAQTASLSPIYIPVLM